MPEENRNIREYYFHVPGYIPGVPGNWPAGSRVSIDEDTKEVLSIWPLGMLQFTPTLVEAMSEAISAQQAELAQPEIPPAVPTQLAG